MRQYTFETYSSMTLLGRRHYFRLVASNGEKVLQSEGYHREQTMLATIRAIKLNARDAPIVKVE